jgi:hypothetical protein
MPLLSWFLIPRQTARSFSDVATSASSKAIMHQIKLTNMLPTGGAKHGKVRTSSLHISENVVQKILTENIHVLPDALLHKFFSGRTISLLDGAPGDIELDALLWKGICGWVCVRLCGHW